MSDDDKVRPLFKPVDDVPTVDPVAGTIAPGPDGGDPLFRIIKRDGYASELTAEDENVRPCDHRRFVLDERWSTVTCRDCKQTVNAFDALMRYATWYLDLERKRMNADHAEREMHVARLQKLKDRVALTVEERNEVLRVIANRYAMKTKDVSELANRIDKVLRLRKQERRRKEKAG